ncbi:hypothetical protein G5C51_11795 [Streptomyces sp. A7024]|uniref:Uncharacterized protein n=1 Tax=Streptomyces coryli TaxID=1128680 RepID=A0A6G4TXP4_9ACTN|nr:hypothetical protein [Streptomyces coryli]NGN64583.1 hypothetical protein [Streptomyces coryli]
MQGTTAELVAAAQAYRRLLQTARAVLDAWGDTPMAAMLLAEPMAEADAALAAAGLAGNEAEFFAMAGLAGEGEEAGTAGIGAGP